MIKNTGAVLKAERLQKNKTLKDISEKTRISIFTLETLEGEHEEFIPPSTYIRGFLKTYALELELDPEEILSLYEQELKEQQKTIPAKKSGQGSSRIPGYLMPVIIGAALLLACALYFGYMGRSSDITSLPSVNVQEEGPAQSRDIPDTTAESAVTTTVVQQAPAAPEADNKTKTATTTTAVAARHFTVRFVAAERSWMRFSVDDKHDFDVLLKAGDTYSVNAVTSVKVRIGNPGGVKAFYNDKPVAVPGTRGTPVTMSFPVPADAKPAR